MSAPPTIRMHENEKDFKFSFFNHLNETRDGRYVIERGITKVNSSRGRIISYKSEDSLPYWFGNGCNMINGTDATAFDPNSLDKRKKLYAFTPEVCRSIGSEFIKESMKFGIPTYRYTNTPNTLANSPENKCFCSSEDKCLPSGAINIAPCTKAPSIMSFPHFYLADEQYLEYVSGLNPEKALHESILEIEPLTATPVVGWKRAQMNMEVRKVDNFDLLANVSTGIFPILWIEEGVELPPKHLHAIKEGLNKLRILNIVKWSIISVGIMLMLSSLLMILFKDRMCSESRTGKVEDIKKSIPDIDGIFISYSGKNYNGAVLNPALYPQMSNRNVNNGHERKSQSDDQNSWQLKDL